VVVASRFRNGSGRRLIPAGLVALIGLVVVGAYLLDRRDPPTRLEPRTLPASAAAVHSYPPGRPAPALRLQGLDGRPVDLAALRGRPVVVNFWATWCGPCVREFPLLRRAAAAHRAERLAVVGVLVNDHPDRARAFADRHRATWPTGVDSGAATAARWAAVGLPHTFFVRPDGTLASHQLGELTQASLARQLAAIVG
jgi:cytochrome c biogenesis protein CcmG, thiol:disulfide interchange protein DsbE